MQLAEKHIHMMATCKVRHDMPRCPPNVSVARSAQPPIQDCRALRDNVSAWAPEGVIEYIPCPPDKRHTDGAEPKGRMVPEKEADAQTFDEQISEIHTAEHRAATISSTEMVHGQAREPPRQTWRVAAVEGRSRVLVVLVGVAKMAIAVIAGVLAVVMDRRFLRAKTRVSELEEGS